MPRNRAAAIVIHNNSLLVMFRKNDKEYFSFPGGGVESDETNEEAVVREIWEEASLKVSVDRLIYQIVHDNGDIHFYFLCRYIEGTPAVQVGTNEYIDNESGNDIHNPQWLLISKANKVTLYPIEIRDQLINDLKNGFVENVIKFELSAVS